MLISFSSFATSQKNLFLPLLRHIGNHKTAFGLADDCPHRHVNHQIVSLAAGTIFSASIPAGLRSVHLAIAKIGKGVEAGIRRKYNVAPLAAIASVRAAIRQIFLSAKGGAPIPAFAGLNIDLDFIYKHGIFAHPFQDSFSFVLYNTIAHCAAGAHNRSRDYYTTLSRKKTGSK